MPAYLRLGTDVDAVNAVCQRLDGLPLAIELAAPWIRVLSATDLLREIDRSLDVLSATSPGRSNRHPSMRAVLDSTWNWLSEDEQRVLSGLGVFVGGFSREAAEVVAGATLASLASLSERSLIYRVPDADDTTRYRMHEIVHHYAREMLQGHPEHAFTVGEGHLSYFLSLTERAHQEWDSPREGVWLSRLQGAEADVDAALAWGLREQRSEPVLRMLAAQLRVWIYSRPPTGFLAVLEGALDLPWDSASPTAAAARARTLNAAGYAASGRGDIRHARQCFAEAIALYEKLGDRSEYAFSLRNFGLALEQAGDVGSAARQFRQSLASCRRAGDVKGAAWSAFHLLSADCAAGRYTAVVRPLLDLIDQFDQLRVHIGSYYAHVVLGHCRRGLGKPLEAIDAYAHAVALQRNWHYKSHGAEILDGLAVVAVDLGQPSQAAVLFGASQAWVDAFSRGPVAIAGSARAEAEQLARTQLGEERFSAALAAGLRYSPDEAMAEAERAVQWLSAMCHAPLPGGLTEREVEVLRLVADGLSNSDIAVRLLVSPRTVHAHLRSIFDKLDVASRTAAVHEANQIGLV